LTTDLKNKFINREISWLAFNERVLQEASDASVPLLERLKFLGIFSSNTDEFFRVRVASLKRMADIGDNQFVLGGKPKRILAQIQEIVLQQRYKSDSTYKNIIQELAGENIFIISEKELNESQGNFVREYFQNRVRPTLVPIMIDSSPVVPVLKDRMIYLAIRIYNRETNVRKKHALIELPTDLVPRFLVLPREGNKTYIMWLDDVIRFCLQEIFSIFEVDTFEAYTIKLTRDAELDLDDEVSESFLQKISKSLKQRKKGRPVRFIYDEEMPAEMLKQIVKRLSIHKGDNLIPGGRYHNFKDFIKFPSIGAPHLINEPRPPVPHKDIPANHSMLDIIHRKDILLHYPYQSFNYVIDMLREAAIDPAVLSIKITLYRVAETSNVVNTLINAVKNGKQVTVVMELQARFDEENNILWANRLREEGAKVIFGMPNLKVHSKLFLITRKEKPEIMRYAYIGTGNFNEVTSRIYSDHGLLTAQRQITDEVNQVFTYLENNFKPGNYKHLLVSPLNMRLVLLSLIHKETAIAKAGKPAYIILKLNSIVDSEMIESLYSASKAGVKIKLIIRGICSLKAGVPGLSENIEAISIVDKHLEHSRILIFGHGGDEKMYIGSADWMTRNLDFRIEVLTPIYDKAIRRELRAFLAIEFQDNVKARVLGETQHNSYKPHSAKAPIRAQDEIYSLLKDVNNAENDSLKTLSRSLLESVVPQGIKSKTVIPKKKSVLKKTIKKTVKRPLKKAVKKEVKKPAKKRPKKA
jgi:polyphosphate kinase